METRKGLNTIALSTGSAMFFTATLLIVIRTLPGTMHWGYGVFTYCIMFASMFGLINRIRRPPAL